jgi:hypothetical protein
MKKTTVYLDAEEYRALKLIAQRAGRTPAALVREAVAEYTVKHARPRRAKSVGAFTGRRRDLGERAEELLAGMGRQR